MCLSCSVNLTLASQSCTTVIVSLDDCTLDQGGDGVYVGDIFGLDYGLPGGWFAGGGNPSASEANRTLGGGGMRGSFTDNTVKNGAANTGGGGMGCEGSTNSQFLGTITRYEMCVCFLRRSQFPNPHLLSGLVNQTCNIARREGSQVWDSWGGNGGSGIVMIVFHVCPCNDNGN